MVDEIAIRAVNNVGECVDILVERNGCSASVDSETVDSYDEGGVTVASSGERVAVGIPNCGDLQLEMEILCETRNGIEMIRFEVTRGFNLRETSHGLLGKPV